MTNPPRPAPHGGLQEIRKMILAASELTGDAAKTLATELYFMRDHKELLAKLKEYQTK